MKTWIVTYKRNGILRKMPIEAASKLLAKNIFFNFFCENCVTLVSITEKRVAI